MDNVTHSLAGLLVAEAAIRLRARVTKTEPSSHFCRVAAISSVIAANLPDADLVYSGLGGSHLSYMLQHRGYTHTVLLAILGAAVVYAVSIRVMRVSARPTRDDSHWLLGLLLVSTLSHLVLDWTNSYGLHPFWPVDNRWYYGDAVFIIEPWLWIVSIPALVRSTRTPFVRVILSLIMLASLVLAWRVDMVSTGTAAALTLGAVVSIALALVLRRDGRIAVGMAGWIAATLIFALASARARTTMQRAVRAANPTVEVLDIVVSPLPANPACASAIAVERSSLSYRVETARVSALPNLVHAADCGGRGGSSGVLIPSTRLSTTALRWDGEWSAPSAELALLARESCYVLAALRFIRVPIWRELSDSTVLLGDVRYGGGSGAGNSFTDVRVPRRSVACPRAVPPWTPPRADLLGR
ncbi:MAG TPA: metal-dependent hydrolase [Gemmatimonadaceae bacterium]|nr:metal-dependent hydrolase [Gemmatimonadaceae bacterium]